MQVHTPHLSSIEKDIDDTSARLTHDELSRWFEETDAITIEVGEDDDYGVERALPFHLVDAARGQSRWTPDDPFGGDAA